MVLEEVYLDGSIGEVHHHGSRGSEPGLESRDTGKLENKNVATSNWFRLNKRWAILSTLISVDMTHRALIASYSNGGS